MFSSVGEDESTSKDALSAYKRGKQPTQSVMSLIDSKKVMAKK